MEAVAAIDATLANSQTLRRTALDCIYRHTLPCSPSKRTLGKGAGGLGLFLLLAASAFAQTSPHIASLFPSGARAGQTIDVTFKGGGLIGVQRLLVSGAPGVSAQIVGGSNAVDETARPVFQSKCTSCHEARSPDNRSMNPDQWASTVTRMITQHGADISNTDRDKIIGYLQGLAKAGDISAKITVAANAAPGMREVRLMTSRGVSSATAFEVGAIPEMLAPTPAAAKPEDAPAIKLPIVINGIMSQSGERDYFRFDARKGQRLSFSVKAQRLNAEEATYFFPTLYVYDSSGKEIAKNLGKYGVDPALDCVVAADGSYSVMLRDLLYHGTPGSVYRLAIGEVPADGVLSPGWARPGENVTAHVIAVAGDAGDSPAPVTASFAVRAPADADGMTMVSTPSGLTPLLVRDLPDGGGPSGVASPPVAVPALFRGEISRAGQTDVFHVHAARGGTSLEIYAQRLGSPLVATVTVKDSNGSVIAERTAGGEDDVRVQNAFPRSGDYTVEVTDANNNGGAGFVYCLEASSGGTDLQLSVSPDTANISPGTSMTLLVKTVRRQNLNGPVTIRVRDLPPGITATDAILLPGMNEAALVLTAAPTVAAGTGGFISIEGTTVVERAPAKPNTAAASDASPTTLRRTVSPVEIFALGNQTIRVPRTTAAVAIRGDAPSFTIALASGQNTIAVTPGQDIRVPISIVRQSGFKGNLFVAPQGLPPGITAVQQTVNVPGDKSEAVIVLRVAKDYAPYKSASGGAVVIPQFAIAGFLATLNNDYVPTVTTAPLTLTVP